MSKDEILGIINEIGKEVFEDENLVINERTVAKDVKGWDSLAHLRLINEIENKFNMKFKLKEIQCSRNVGELISYIIQHLEERV